MGAPKRIGILSSGGDAPGMNAAIRTVVRAALAAGMKVYGIQKGYHGLVHDLVQEMNSRSVADIIQRGGTILKTARSSEFVTEAGFAASLATLAKYGIEGLVVIGGDGSFKGAEKLAAAGVATVGIPATIDNDIASTQWAIGFDTAVNTVVEAINKIRDTAASHERTYVIEVMGRSSGYIALHAGLAGGAEVILIPEQSATLDEVCERVLTGQQRGKSRSIVVVAEGYRPNIDNGSGSAGFTVGNYIREKTGLETRVTVLGHLQRGGNPTALDRIIATQFGYKAVQVLQAGQGSKVVGLNDNKITVFDIDEALAKEKTIDTELYHIAEIVSAS